MRFFGRFGMKSRSRYMCRIRKALYLDLRKMIPGKTTNTLGLSVMRSFKTHVGKGRIKNPVRGFLQTFVDSSRGFPLYTTVATLGLAAYIFPLFTRTTTVTPRTSTTPNSPPSSICIFICRGAEDEFFLDSWPSPGLALA